jgi:glycosyltransferase involved in cell wall biosynthesis
MHENFAQQVKNKKWIPFFIRYFLSFIIKLLERVVLINFHVILAEKSYAKHYLWINNKKVIQNFPILNQLNALIDVKKRNTFTVGYMGDVTFDRGIPVIAEAVAQLRLQGVPAEFVCIGAVHDDALDSPPFQKGLSQGWLHATGRLQPEEAWSLMATCHVGAALLRPIGNYVESYPTKMFEYMAMGLPVLVSNFSLYREIVDEYHCGFCVDPENVAEVTRALVIFLHNWDQSREMGRRGADAVLEKFNWETEKKKLIGFYERMIKKDG